MSTPIARIPEDPHKTLDEDQELVQSIIQEIKSQENPPPQQQPPPQVYEEENTQEMESPQEQYQYYEEAPHYHREPAPEPPRKIVPETSLWKRLWNEAKEPLLVLVLYIVSNLRILDKVFMRYVPRMASDIGTLNFLGVLAKGIIVTILFFLLKKVIK